jgi:exodeoxyribonuclease VII small subunit
MENELTYTAAFDELQQIVADMEDGEITVDDLAVKVKRAAELIKICKPVSYTHLRAHETG